MKNKFKPHHWFGKLQSTSSVKQPNSSLTRSPEKCQNQPQQKSMQKATKKNLLHSIFLYAVVIKKKKNTNTEFEKSRNIYKHDQDPWQFKWR